MFNENPSLDSGVVVREQTDGRGGDRGKLIGSFVAHFHLALQFHQTMKPSECCYSKDGRNKWEKFNGVFVIHESVLFVGGCITR